ncbi:MAG: polyprenyl synthetase family protein [Bacteroidetes bacterium]|nr:MAG: polyprenyl synthetase family protein [Bacteroidota bacterium]
MHSIKELQNKVADIFDNKNYMAEPKGLYEPIQYSLSQGGKRLRPLLALMSCSIFGGDLDKVENPAIGLEIFHNFTLLHDDIMDQAPIRRGVPSVYKKWDTNTAILSGDTMFVLAYDYVTKSDPSFLVDVLRVFNQTAREVCEGQQYDMNYETQEFVGVDDYIEMIRLKTAVLIAAALKIGAITAGAKADDAKNIYDFGINIGLAFQLRDDLLDAFGDQKVFGKPIGNDIVTNKKTYLYIMAYNLANTKQKEALDTAFGFSNNEEKVKSVMTVFNELNIREVTEQKIEDYYEKSLSFLDAISVPKNQKEELYRFAKGLSLRNV